MENCTSNSNMEAWENFLNLIEERYPACVDSDKEEDILLCNAIVEFLASACN